MTEMGFTQQQAEEALAKHSSFQQALDSLLAGFGGCSIGSALSKSTANSGSAKQTTSAGSSSRRQKSPPRLHPLLINQQSESRSNTVQSVPPPQTSHSPVDVKMDPSNPEGLTALWVGNVLPQVSEKKLLQMFSRYGTITSIRSLPDKFCAFINFKDKESASQALLGLQGVDCAGQKLLIKFPDHPLTSSSPSRTVGKTSAPVATRKMELPQRFRKK